MKRTGSRAFTLIEMMVALVVLSLLLMMGLPAFGTYLQNAKLRTAAESFYTGLQAARAEAVKTNTNTEFVLTSDNGNSSSAQTATATTTGPNWIIRSQGTGGIYTFVAGKDFNEGSGQASGTTVSVSSTASTITFTGFGSTSLGATATLSVTNPVGGACAPTGQMRCLNVVVSVGGQVRLCDPAVSATGDTRKC